MLRVFYLLPGLILIIFSSAAVTADQIYKWMDKNGVVHFSDQPNPEIDSQTVTIQPGPTEQQIEQARQTEQKIRQSGDELAEQNAQRDAQREAEAARRRKENAAAEQQKQLEQFYQQPAQSSGWYYGWTGIHPRPPRPRPPHHRPPGHQPPAKPVPPMHPVPAPLPNAPVGPR